MKTRKLKGYLLLARCPNCNGALWGYDIEVTDDNVPEVHLFRVVICPTCDEPPDGEDDTPQPAIV